MRPVKPNAKRLLPRYEDFAHLRAHLSQASDEKITMCMNKHLLKGATMSELLALVHEDNRRLQSNDFLDEGRIMGHIRWCCEPHRGWMIEKNKYGVYRLVGYRGEREERIDAEHAEQRSQRFPRQADTKPTPEPVIQKKYDLQNEGHVSGTKQRIPVATSDFGRGNEVASGGLIMDKMASKVIITNAVESTRTRWSKYAESWKNIDIVFILRGYEQQGFQLFKMRPILEGCGLLSIAILGDIISRYPYMRNYERQFAGSLNSEFYSDLRKGVCGKNGQLFEGAVRIFLDRKMGNPGRIFWKLLYQMLQACTYLKQYYASSFARYVVSKYENFANRHHLSGNDFLSIAVSEWESFLKKAKPWSELKGIGPNVFDFIFGDIVEAMFVENSYKFDSANQYFLSVTGISKLIKPFDREATTLFLKQLEMPYGLREINKGVYTYCSVTESENYGFCRDRYKCNFCNVKDICAKNI